MTAVLVGVAQKQRKALAGFDRPPEFVGIAPIRVAVADRALPEADVAGRHVQAALLRDELILYLSAPGAGSGGQAGGDPKPGGWNRFMVVTNELDVLIERLRRAGARFRGDISDGGAGRAILLEDPSGNVIELFEFKQN